MPTPCYISITGQTQGNITAGAFTADSVGNIYVQGHEDEMLEQEFLHNVTVPTDLSPVSLRVSVLTSLSFLPWR
ncbi:putative type VI secretion system protein [Escherichia coli]|uniref:Type VI secretion system protein n=1 Tax=Escherichia coli TaxID=562 RepID=A0AAX2KFE2_ECOLX|nr:putative type VI secretion system protein [Escherichia coli]